jgi:hypothetical protein
MNRKCGKRWTQKEIRDKFTIIFINNDLKAQKENNLFEREKALMPISQQEANWQLTKESREKEKSELDKKIKEMIKEMIEEFKNTVLKPFYDRITEITEPSKDKEKSEGKFIKVCGVTNCKGFLSTKWKCGLCEVYTCNECGIVKGKVGTMEYENHICSADDIATMKLISSDTRACPKCAEGIYKISGCDQMWCTCVRRRLVGRLDVLRIVYIIRITMSIYERKVLYQENEETLNVGVNLV